MSYGLEIYDTDGVTKVVSDDIAVIHVLNSVSFTVSPGSSIFFPCDMTDLTTSNSGLYLIIELFEIDSSDITRSSTGFTFNNNTGVFISGVAIILRHDQSSPHSSSVLVQ